METFSLFELNEHIRRVIALNFEDALWVRCEIAQIKEARGHHYLELIEKDADGAALKAQSAAVIWAREFSWIKRKFGDVVDQVLQDGVEVRIRVRVDFHERYGLKLMVEDLDPTFTLGNLELKRQEILKILHEEGQIGRNSALPIPAVVQRIAVLSTLQAAGYLDFVHHLTHNAYGYRYDAELFSVAVQGQLVEAEVSAALGMVSDRSDDFDCVVLIRGGGSRIDLSGFDSLEIGRAIARCPVPVFTGIGHEVDQTVADVVAHTALKTPTAVADFLIEINLQFDATITAMYQEILRQARERVARSSARLGQLTTALRTAPASMLSVQRTRIQQILPSMQQFSRMRVKTLEQLLTHAGEILHAMDPERTLKRGFSITTRNAEVITDVSTLSAGDQVETQLATGRFTSTVNDG